jgi:hypothetical protein
VKGCNAWRNFREFYKGEVRRIPIPRTPLNKGKKKGRSYYARPFLLRLYGDLGAMIRSRLGLESLLQLWRAKDSATNPGTS